MANQHPAYMAAAAKTVASRLGADLPPTGHTHTRAMAGVIEHLAGAAETLGTLYDRQSPTDTVSMHQKKVGAASKAFGEVVARARAQLNEIMQRGMRDIEERSRAKTGLRPNEFAAEVRASVRNMGFDEKLTLFNDLAKEGRGAELSAVIDAPPLLSGVTPDMQQRAKDMLESFHAAAEKQERELLASAFGQAFDMTTNAATVATHMGDPRLLAEIEQGEAAAAAAVQAFQQATRG